jgi:putative hemolysin
MAVALPFQLTPFPWGDVAIILGLIALNGVFAMSELAIVSARRARLESITRTSQLRGARAAIDLASNPGRVMPSGSCSWVSQLIGPMMCPSRSLLASPLLHR